MENKITKKEYEALLKMVQETSYSIQERGDLETRHSDGEDFLDQAVWSLKEMLINAYMMGKNARG